MTVGGMLPSDSFLAARGARLAAALFDARFYDDAYPDVRAAGIQAFDHYMSIGWREGRRPNATFDTSYYLSAYPDVAEGGWNPLVHYVTIGVFEYRMTSCSLDALDANAVLKAVPVRRLPAGGQSIEAGEASLSFNRLQETVASAFGSVARGCVIAVSHDQYVVNTGGVQNVIAAESVVLREAGWVYVHLCPAIPQALLVHEISADQVLLVLTIDGRRAGVAPLADLVRALSAPLGKISARLVVHHLMGSCIDAVIQLARLCTAQPPIVWLHDLFGLCVNPFLLRNNASFCHAPDQASNACMVCNSGEERGPHLAAMRRLFDELHPIVLAPSRIALDFWRTHITLPHAAAAIVSPARIELGDERTEYRKDRPLRVAHAGPALSQKGWNTFQRLVADHRGDARYDFYRLGYGVLRTPGVTEVHVQVTPDNPDAMSNAIRDHEIDVIIHWSSCFETFSFVTLEAMAGGAFVVAREGAGNVWPAVAAVGLDRGMPVRTEVELRSLFISGEIAERARKPRTVGRLQRTRGTADLLLGITTFGHGS